MLSFMKHKRRSPSIGAVGSIDTTTLLTLLGVSLLGRNTLLRGPDTVEALDEFTGGL